MRGLCSGYGSRIVTLPDSAEEILTIAEICENFDIDRDDQNEMLMRFREAAIAEVQDRLNRQFVTATWELTLDRFPSGGAILLPRNPVQSITSVQYVDTNGDTQTLSTSEYQTVLKREPAAIVPAYTKAWPSTRPQPEAVTVTYVAGYGQAQNVPNTAKQLLALMVGGMYEMRESRSAEQGVMVAIDNPAVQSLLNNLTYGDEFLEFAAAYEGDD